MEIGDKVRIRAYKEDGTCYRWWSATVEAACRYGYSEDFRQACYAAAREAVELANSWAPGQAPTSRD